MDDGQGEGDDEQKADEGLPSGDADVAGGDD